MTPTLQGMRVCCGLAGGAVLAFTWLGPFTSLAGERFAAHAGLHVAVVCVVAPLLAVAIGGSRLDPVRRRPHGFSPLAAAMLELLVVWLWHAPGAIEAARAAPALLVVQHASFLAASLLLWVSVLGGDGETRYERAGVGIIALLLTSMHMTLLGVLTMIAARPLYVRAPDVAQALADQRLGGLLILVGAGMVYLVAGLVLIAWLLRSRAGVPAARRPA